MDDRRHKVREKHARPTDAKVRSEASAEALSSREARIDADLEETFPASDPVPVRPGSD